MKFLLFFFVLLSMYHLRKIVQENYWHKEDQKGRIGVISLRIIECSGLNSWSETEGMKEEQERMRRDRTE